MHYKKRLNILIVFSIIFIILSLSIVSAFSFSEFFNGLWNKITGKAVGGYSNLVLYFPFNESQGNITYDLSGFGNNGILDIRGTEWTEGKIGNALDFGGIYTGVTVNGDENNGYVISNLDNLKTFSAFAWIYPRNNSYEWGGCMQPTIISKSIAWYAQTCRARLDWGTGYWGLDTISGEDNKIKLRSHIGYNETVATSLSTATIELEKWYFVGMTYDETGDRKIHLYINGQEVEYESQIASKGTKCLDYILPVKVGSKEACSASTFNGTIDEVKVWDKVLTTQEIQEEYERGEEPEPTPTPPPQPNITIEGYIEVATLKNEYNVSERVELTNKSLINNTGNESIFGYLSMKVQKYVGGKWYDFKVIVGTSETGNYNCGPHTADYNPQDWKIDYNEFQRVLGFYNNKSYHCDSSSEDGYAPGNGSHDCKPHSSDYAPQNWKIELEELSRIIQFYGIGAYQCNSSGEDGYFPLGWKVPGLKTKISPGEYLVLDKIWADAGYFTADEAGQYRVYAALLDENRNIIKTESGTLEDTYEFLVKGEELECIDGTFYGTCSATKPKYCQNGTLIDNCQLCGCPTNFECQIDGVCESIVWPNENTKNISKYSEREVFLISDKNWQDVLQLVPLTTWTSSNDSKWCNKGYGTAESVCVYPTLIFHEEEGYVDELNLDRLMKPEYFKINGMEYSEWSNKLWLGGHNFNPYIINFEQETHIDFYICPLFRSHESILIENVEIIYWPYSDYLTLKEGSSTIINVNRVIINTECLYIEPPNYNVPIFEYKNLKPSGFDADSIIYFMQQYSPDKATIIGNTPEELDDLLLVEPELGAGLNNEQIIRTSTDNYLSYWESYKDIVYVEDNYELALMASTYASLLNAPLVIQGKSLDKDEIFENRNIICVGNVNRNCNENYNLEELQKKYIELTNTDKIILVNPNDLDIKVEEQFQPEKSANFINEIYSKTSLAAPILASAKHEVILSVKSTDYQEVDSFIESKIRDLGINAEYLTIIASPDAIPWKEDYNKSDPYDKSKEVDNHLYGNLDNDLWQELIIGRIFGISISDVSSHTARNLFYGKLNPELNYLLISGDISSDMIEAEAFENLMNVIGINGVNAVDPSNDLTDIDLLLDKSMILYWGHGGYSGLQKGITSSSLANKWLSPSIIALDACSTGDFERAKNSETGFGTGYLFSPNLLRRGALSVITAVRSAGNDITSGYPLFDYFSIKENTIGESFKNFKHYTITVYNFTKNYNLYDTFYIILGDPTFIGKKVDVDTNDLRFTKVEYNDSAEIIDIKIPITEVMQWEYEKGYENFFKIKEKVFLYPLNVNTPNSVKSYSKYYEYGELKREVKYDFTFHIFYVDLPLNKKIKGIKKVEYIDEEDIIELEKMPVFDVNSWELSNLNYVANYTYYYRDNNIKGRYWFLLYDSLGGDPLIIKTQDAIQPYKFRIYLELEEVTQ